jgi:hypothetical protein
MLIRYCLSLCLLWAASASAASDLLPPELIPIREKGMNALFNMDYQGARSAFEEMTSVDPRNPAGYVYIANTIWLGHLAELRRLQTNIYNRGNSFFSKTEDTVDPKIDKEFRGKIERAITLCEARLNIHKDDIPALYYLGIAKNIVAGYEATVKRSFISALKNGSKGVGFHREILEKDPQCIDAQLSVGMYNYVVGSLPFAVKILALLGGVHGSKKDGIAMLERVAKDGNFAKDEGNILLVMLYKREKRVPDALAILNLLAVKYPGNSLFRLERAGTLGELKKYSDSANQFEALLKDPVAYDYIPDLIHFQYATMLSDEQKWSVSYEHFVAAYTSRNAPEALVTLAHLNAGKCLDVQSKREEAMKEYKLVLSRKDVFDSYDQAKQYLKKPFHPGE